MKTLQPNLSASIMTVLQSLTPECTQYIEGQILPIYADDCNDGILPKSSAVMVHHCGFVALLSLAFLLLSCFTWY